jgi:hypothetical protein
MDGQLFLLRIAKVPNQDNALSIPGRFDRALAGSTQQSIEQRSILDPARPRLFSA